MLHQKKSIEDYHLKHSPPLLGSVFLHPILPFFPTMQASIAFMVYQQKANIFNFLEMAAKFVWFIPVPYHIDLESAALGLNPSKVEPRSLWSPFCGTILKKTTHSCNATQNGLSGSSLLIRCKLRFCDWATHNAQQNRLCFAFAVVK